MVFFEIFQTCPTVITCRNSFAVPVFVLILAHAIVTLPNKLDWMDENCYH